MSIKAGAQMSNAEKWMHKADEWKHRAEQLAEQLAEARSQIDELQETLDHIAELAAPDRVTDSDNIAFIKRGQEMLLNRLIGPEAIAAITPAPKPEYEEDNEHDGEEAKSPQDDPELIAEALKAGYKGNSN